jgi:hypothetical protein
MMRRVSDGALASIVDLLVWRPHSSLQAHPTLFGAVQETGHEARPVPVNALFERRDRAAERQRR